jgi:phosphomannomutase/phosphoglucomutase
VHSEENPKPEIERNFHYNDKYGATIIKHMEREGKLFGTNGIRGTPNRDLTSDFALNVGRACATVFGTRTIAMGRDTRDTGDMLFSAVMSGVLSTGVDVIDLGILPTPAVQYYCKVHGLYGIVITASHNPPEFNGIKCIDRDGTELRQEDERRIEDAIHGKNWTLCPWDRVGRVSVDTRGGDIYISSAITKVDASRIRSRRFRVAVDCGNGAAYLTTPKLLRALGCSVVELNSYPDGQFTSRQSEPKPENLADLISVMKSGNFSLGIAHDGDADRAVFIDENGNFIDGDQSLSLLISSIAGKGDTVVTPVSSSDNLEHIAQQKGFNVVRTRVGAPIVSRTIIERKAKIGGEENGGVIYGEHQYCRDGAMTVALMLNLIAESGKKISELVSSLPGFRLCRTTMKTEGRDPQKILHDLENKKLSDNIDHTDGLKIYMDGGWALVRASGTEPIIRIYGHGKSMEEAEKINRKVTGIISSLL